VIDLEGPHRALSLGDRHGKLRTYRFVRCLSWCTFGCT